MSLQLDGVGKRYGDGTWALRDVSLELDTGIVGLLGPNGAGKSTLIRTISALLTPTEGTVRWNGDDVAESPNALRRDLGYLPQEFGVYPSLTAAEFLDYLAALRGIDSETAAAGIDELLRATDLEAARDRRLDSFSGGMRRRVGIAAALLDDPELLVVDEPTAGLDPERRVQFRNLIAELAGDRLILLSTHVVPDVEATASEVAILNEGRLLAHETPASLIDAVEGNVWSWVVPDGQLADVRAEHFVSNTARRSDGVEVRLVAADQPDAAAEQCQPTLEDAYLYRLATGR